MNEPQNRASRHGPARVIGFLIVHEVDKYCPEYQKQVAWLKINGAALEL